MIHSRSKFLLWPGLLVLLLAGGLTLALTRPTPQVNVDRDQSSGSQHPVTDETAQAKALETYGNLPMAFIANRGQTDSRVRFMARGAGHTFHSTPAKSLPTGEFPISTDPANQFDPAISGDTVVWVDERNGNQDIYAYDLSTQTEFPITTNPANQYAPAISDDIVVWTDTRNGNGDIYGYDLSTQTEFRITTDPANQYSPAVSGDTVVWGDYRNGNEDIYAYNLSTQVEFPVSTALSEKDSPAISGDIVIWRAWTDGNTDIYGYDLSTQTEFPISLHPAPQEEPAIWGNIAVWEDWRGAGEHDIYGYDLSTQAEFPITTNPASQHNPVIWGDMVVWADCRNYSYFGGCNIYGYDLSTQAEFPISTHHGTRWGVSQWEPAIWDGIVVWVDNRNGNSDIYGLQFEQPLVALQVDPLKLDFRVKQGVAKSPTQEVGIGKLGTRSLDWTANTDNGWLNLSPTAGAVPAKLGVSVDTTGLALGDYTGNITVTATTAGALNTPQIVEVDLHVPYPELQVAPASLYFGAVEGAADPMPQQIEIANDGSDPLEWEVTTDVGWLSITPSSGTAPSTIDAFASIGGFTPGSYTGYITVTATTSGTLNTPQTVPVELTIVGTGTCEICGIITEDTTWTAAGSPYLVSGDLSVGTGVTLTIEPGTEVRFATTDALSGGDPDKVELIVAGTLIADGVTFTSNADTPAAGDWYGIRFLNSSTDWDGSGGSIITNSTIEYGTVGISIDGASPMISNNIIVDMKGADGEQPECPGGLPEENPPNTNGKDGYGIHITRGSAATVTGNAVANIFGGTGALGCVYGWLSGEGGRAVGIYVESSSPTIEQNQIRNIAGGRGAIPWPRGGDGVGIYLDASHSTVDDNDISFVAGGDGRRLGSASFGVGIWVGNESSVTIVNNIISSIRGGTGAGAYCDIRGGVGAGDGGLGVGVYVINNSSTTITNNLVSETVGGSGGNGLCPSRGGTRGDGGIGAGIYAVNSSPLDINNNVVFGAHGGNGGNGASEGAHLPPSPGGNGGTGVGIYAEASSATLLNNIVVSSAGGLGGMPGDPNVMRAQRVGDPTDDAQESANGYYNDDGPYVLLGDENGAQNYVGFRFYTSIPQGAIIDSAVLTVTAYDDRSGITQFLIKGETTGNSPTFSADDSPRDRTPTAAGVIWSVTEPWVQGQTYASPDLLEVIQEIENRDDWRLGSALTILVLDVAVDNRNRTVSTSDKDYQEAAELSIAWHWPEAVSGKRGEDGIGVGIDLGASSTMTITNNIVVSHTIGISSTTGTANLAYNDVWDNSQANYAGLSPGTNDISVDPLFRNPAGDDYHLCAASLLIDAGTNDGVPATDIDGDVRPYDGDNDGVAVADIGADEWLPGPPFLTVSPLTLDFVGTAGRSDPEPQAINILDCGSPGTLQWAAETDAHWLYTCPLSGVTTSTATVFVDTGGLSMGRYTGTITITSQTAGVLNSPQTVVVALKLVPLGDIDEDCEVDVGDVMEVANRWRVRQGDPSFLKAGDVNDDGVINIADIQKVAAQWGIACPQGYNVPVEVREVTDEQGWCGQHLPQPQE